MRNSSIYNKTANYNFRSSLKIEAKKESDNNLVLTHLINESEYYTAELAKADKELRNLMSDLAKYVNKTKDRESELRSHIYNLSEKIRIKDIDKVKSTMNELQLQIMENISEIETLKAEEISKKKTDIDNRINLRIMDSEFRFKNILSNKLDEEDNILRNLNEYTKEMEKIKENYDNIKKKSENLTKENKVNRNKIKEFEIKNSKLKIELSNLKKYFNYVCLKIQNKKMIDNSNLISIHHSRSKSRDVREVHEVDKNKISNYVVPEVDFDIIKNILQDESYVLNNPRTCGIISSLANILENLRLRINKLKAEMNLKIKSNNLEKKIIDLMKPSKSKSLSKSLHILPNKNNYLNTMIFQNEVTMNKELREDFVNSLIKDPDILNMVNGEQIPDTILFKKRLLMN